MYSLCRRGILNRPLSKSSRGVYDEVEDAVAKKKKWIKEADKKVEDAKKKLKEAKEALHVYLRDEEFEVVDHKVMIELKGRDMGVDQWRTGRLR